MSRTYKDAPWTVRGCRDEGRKCPSDWRTRWDWRDGAPKRHEFENYDDYLAADVAWMNDQPTPAHWSNHLVGEIARQQNRAYRSRTSQLVREGRYNEIDRPRRNARWLAW